MTSYQKIQTEAIGDHLRDDFLPMSRTALSLLGVSSQTLGAMYRLMDDASGETFKRTELIASMACRSFRSTKRDLQLLTDQHWIVNRGREQFSNKSMRKRRTNTLVVTKEARQFRKSFLKMPRWLCLFERRWSVRITLAAIIDRHLLISDLDLEDEHGRECYSLKKLSADTGLSMRSTVEAKRKLVTSGVVEVSCFSEGNTWSSVDELRLNTEFKLPSNIYKRPYANVA